MKTTVQSAGVCTSASLPRRGSKTPKLMLAFESLQGVPVADILTKKFDVSCRSPRVRNSREAFLNASLDDSLGIFIERMISTVASIISSICAV